ncbi:Cbs1p [Saccharomyces eubayanus]|uniref:Cbs1p n=1 Tax=Saccharomyces eubayanus TaxID=1080349 RepID=UPI0006BEEBB6|nr:CBS1-like protein [Saccharomyces eubayanus]KOH00295.1 CBS1-like protein [Saccharomyces eubayanus]
MLRTQAFVTVRSYVMHRNGSTKIINTVTKKNVAKVEKLCHVFQVDHNDDGGKIRLPTKELTKLLYTTNRDLQVQVTISGDTSTNNDFRTSNEILQKLGEQLINLEINKLLTITFTNFNQFNVMNKNFNYIHNLERRRIVNSSSISWLINDSLKINQLAHLRIPVKLPKEMGLNSSSKDFQNLNDWKVILSFVGYLKLLDNKNNSKMFVDSIIKIICLPLINFHLGNL